MKNDRRRCLWPFFFFFPVYQVINFVARYSTCFPYSLIAFSSLGQCTYLFFFFGQNQMTV
ncbi:uncharacterized protein EV154DRAFT_501675, partial [Mucor mucedo]|uniref:uncharacterized protein n=1 Tax=Mucor mucedo TaxID=29922 RepID=UPI002220CAD9